MTNSDLEAFCRSRNLHVFLVEDLKGGPCLILKGKSNGKELVPLNFSDKAMIKAISVILTGRAKGLKACFDSLRWYKK